MKDHWKELVRQARLASTPAETVSPVFEAAVFRRLASAERESLLDCFVPLLRPAVGLAFTAALACILLQGEPEAQMPDNLLVQTDQLIRLAVLE